MQQFNKSGCGAVGSALDWGSRGREFKSRHSDQIEPETQITFQALFFIYLSVCLEAVI